MNHAVRTLAPQPPPPGIYASKYTPQLGAVICARMMAGESLRAICRADPAMPTEKTVWNWRRAHPAFAARIERVMLERRALARERQAALALIRQIRRSRTGRTAWNRGRSCYSDAVADKLFDRLLFGEPLYQVCRTPGMPSLGTVYTWLRTRPAFLARYRRVKGLSFDVVMQDAMERARDCDTYRESMSELGRAERAGIWQCARLSPKVYGEGIYGSWD